MHVHQINTQTHQAFLNQQREDPVTGERIKEGDQVVFCTACKSAFLLGSWNYLGNQHCGQEETLVEVPQQTSINLKWALENRLWPPKEKAHKEAALERKLMLNIATGGLVLSIGSMFYLIFTILKDQPNGAEGVFLFMSIVLTFVLGTVVLSTLSDDLTKTFELYENGVRIFKGKKQHDFRLNALERIHLTGTKQFKKDNHGKRWIYDYRLHLVFGQNHQPKSVAFPVWTYDQALHPYQTRLGGKERNLLFALMRFSTFIPVSMSVFETNEHLSNYIKFFKAKFELSDERFSLEVI